MMTINTKAVLKRVLFQAIWLATVLTITALLTYHFGLIVAELFLVAVLIGMVYGDLPGVRKLERASGESQLVNGHDPISLVLDEAATIDRALTNRHREMFKAISERGRARGVSLPKSAAVSDLDDPEIAR
jgi:hypothetical protein